MGSQQPLSKTITRETLNCLRRSFILLGKGAQASVNALERAIEEGVVTIIEDAAVKSPRHPRSK